MTNRKKIEQKIIKWMEEMTNEEFQEEFMTFVDEASCKACKARNGGKCPHPDSNDLDDCGTIAWLNEEAENES